MEQSGHIPPEVTAPPPEPVDKFTGRLQQVVFGLFLVFVVLLSIEKISDDDVFWHLATGRWIVQNGSIPSQDIFGFVTQGQAWIPFEWGWDVLTYALFSITGNYTLLQFLPAVIWLLICGIQIAGFRKFGIAPPIIIVILTLELFACLYSIAARPYCISLLGLTIVGYIIFTFKYTAPETSTGKRLYWLPLIFLVWTNMHPGVIGGIFLLFIILLSEFLLYSVIRPSSKGSSRLPVRGMSAESILKLELIFALCVFAIVINPHGLRTFDFIYQHTKLWTLTTIKEWLPPFSGDLDNPLLVFYVILLILGATAIYYSFRRRYPLPALLYAAFALLSLRAVRFVADFALISMYGTALALEDLIPEQPPLIRKLLNGKFVLYLLISLEVGLIAAVTNDSLYDSLKYHRHFGLGVDPHFFSESAIKFLKTNSISGNPFNQFELGGFLIWELPSQKNFIDSRNLSDQITETYFSIADVNPGFEKKLDYFGIEYILLHLPEMSHTPKCMESTLISYCSAHRDRWKLVYWDDFAFVYLRDLPKYRNLIGKSEYKVLDPYLFAFRHHVFDSLRTALPAEYRKELQRKIAEDSSGTIARAFIYNSRIK